MKISKSSGTVKAQSCVNLISAVMAILLVGGCSSNPTATTATAPIDVKVMFDGICPVSVDPSAMIHLDKAAGDKVRWTAVDLATGLPKKIKYEIFFDPFVDGKPLKDSNGDGIIESSPVGPNVPANVVYKYTIYNVACTAKDPLDPRIKVD